MANPIDERSVNASFGALAKALLGREAPQGLDLLLDVSRSQAGEAVMTAQGLEMDNKKVVRACEAMLAVLTQAALATDAKIHQAHLNTGTKANQFEFRVDYDKAPRLLNAALSTVLEKAKRPATSPQARSALQGDEPVGTR